MSYFVLLAVCFLPSTAHGNGWCNEPSFQKYAINSPLLFSCDDSQLKDEIASLQQKIEEKDMKLSQLQESVQNISDLLSSADQQQPCNCPTATPNSELLQEFEQIVQRTCNFSELIEETRQIREDLAQIQMAVATRGTQFNPATSCSEITTTNDDGRYWLVSGTRNVPVQVTCDFNVRLPPFRPVEGWQEIANLNLSDPSQSCPLPWRESMFENSRRCERAKDGHIPGCASVLFPTGGVAFTRLCGRAVGYAEPVNINGFNLACQSESNCDINDINNDGIVITDDSNNQQHIWSLAVGRTAVPVTCPCVYAERIVPVPDFVGEDYYCDHSSGRSTTLWDGEGCTQGACCANPDLPWFCREFDQPILTDNIEVRICSTGPIIELDLLKLFIQ